MATYVLSVAGDGVRELEVFGWMPSNDYKSASLAGKISGRVIVDTSSIHAWAGRSILERNQVTTNALFRKKRLSTTPSISPAGKLD
jgi:hypothetical protein